MNWFKNFTVPIVPIAEAPMRGAGVIHKNKRYITHTTLPNDNSALSTITLNQLLLIFLFGGLSLAGLIIAPLATLTILMGIMSVLYFADVLFNVVVIARSLKSPPEIKISEYDLSRVNDEKLPVYTILCPLYKESAVLPDFVESIKNLNWPKGKLDVQLLLEEDDGRTIDATKELNLPDYIRTVIVPLSQPKTKPKACNYGLTEARGEYLVIYDAEDRPDPWQLKKVYLAFERAGKEVKCLQAKLNYFNPKQNLLTRLFTIEYSLWFDVILPGLQTLETSIPLGGTSNHFRTRDLRGLHGWDPFNVTEDCDLGVRLFKKGYRTAIIDSITYEEANSHLGNWLRQRSRWIKGYMQTFLVHMRSPGNFFNEKGMHALYFQLTVGGKILFILINPVMWTLTLSYILLYKYVGPQIRAIYPSAIYSMALASLIFGNFLCMYSYMVGAAKRHDWHLMKYVFLQPLYWLLVSMAGVIALYQLVFKPHYWEKTRHGLTKSHGSSFTLDFLGLFRIYDTAEAPNKLRFLVFNWRDTQHAWAGGAEVYVQEIAKEWIKQGHKVTIFCGNDGVHPRNEVVDGVQIIRRGGLYTVYFWAAIYYLLKFRNYFDVVIDCENGIPFFTPLYIHVPKFLLIFHVHQRIFHDHLNPPFRQLASLLEGKIMPLVYRNQTVVTISPSTHDEIISRGIAKKRSVQVVEPGVRRKLFANRSKTLYPSFVYVGRLKTYKNIDVAIRAFAGLYRDYPDAKLTIAGRGDTRPALLSMIKELNLTEAVTLTGKVSDSDKIQMYGSAWAAIQPSSYEGWGLTVIEANAAGTPVIAANVPGLRDAVLPGKTGLLVKRRDIVGLQQAMRMIIENTAARQQLSQSAQSWAAQFRWDQSAAKFSEVIYETLRKKAKSDNLAPAI